MAISIRGTATAWQSSTGTTLTVTLPTHQAGDMLIVRAFRKPYAGTMSCGTAGWAECGTQFANGTTTVGSGSGSMKAHAYWKIATSSSETSPVVTWGTTAAPGGACAIAYQKGADDVWATPVGVGGLNSTAATTVNDQLGTHVAFAAGDMYDFWAGWTDDIGTPATPSIAQTGVTFDTVGVQPATALDISTSNDLAAHGGYRLATAGTSSAAATITAAYGSSEQHIVWATRLRVVPVQVTAVAEVGLADGQDPAVHTGHKIKLRARIQANGVNGCRMWAALYEGANNRSGNLEISADLTNTLTNYELAISEANAANISSYSSLSIRFWGRDAYAASNVFEVDYICLETPAAAGLETVSAAGALTPAGALMMKAKQVKAGAITPSPGTLTRFPKQRPAGALTPGTGALLKKPLQKLAGALTPGPGALANSRKLLQSLAGALTPGPGTLTRFLRRTFTGTVTPAGALVNFLRRTFTGAVTPGPGTVANKGRLVKTGTVTPGPGTLTRKPKPLWAGTLTPGPGTLARKPFQRLAGSLTPAGALLDKAKQLLAGTLTPSGIVTHPAGTETVAVSGTLAPAGTLLKKARTLWAGALTPAGALLRKTAKRLAGALVPAGALAVKGRKLLLGFLAPAGTLLDKARQLLSGSLASAGTLTHPAQGKFLSVSGAITPTGALLWIKHVALEGFIAPVGQLYHFAYAWLTAPGGGRVRSLRPWAGGTVTVLGWMSGRVNLGTGSPWVWGTAQRLGWFLGRVRRLSSDVGPAVIPGVQTLTSRVKPEGELAKFVRTFRAGSLTPVGTLVVTKATQLLEGALAPVGALLRKAAVSMGGTLAPSGTVTIPLTPPRVAVIGELAPAGALARAARKRPAGALAPAGSKANKPRKLLAGSLAPGPGVLTIPVAHYSSVAGALTPGGATGMLGPVRQINRTQLSFSLEWWCQPAMSGRVEYADNAGFSGSLLTVKQVDPLAHHIQFIGAGNPVGAPALQPNTVYYCRVVEATTAGGQTVTSPTYVFTTGILQVAAAGTITPLGALSQSKLGLVKTVSLAGAITPSGSLAAQVVVPESVYGPAIRGYDKGNMEVRPSGHGIVAFVFKAINGGVVSKVRFQVTNRYPPDYGGGVPAGTFRVGVQAMNGGVPSGTWLGNYAIWEPVVTPANFAALVTLSGGPTLTLGQLYAVIVQNVHADPETHWSSINCMYNPWGTLSPLQPMYPADENKMLVGGPDAWAPINYYLPCFDLEYVSGLHEGMAAIMGQDYDNVDQRDQIGYVNSGSKGAWSFTPPAGAPSRTVDAVNFVMRKQTGSNNATLVVKKNGSTAATGTFTTSGAVAAGSHAWPACCSCRPQAGLSVRATANK